MPACDHFPRGPPWTAQQGRRHPRSRGAPGRPCQGPARRPAAERGRDNRDHRARGRRLDAADARGRARRKSGMTRATTVLASLSGGLHAALADDERVLVLGEDVLDPYGGAFKVTRGLSSQFPDRVLTTPISEAAIVAVATGLALRGFRPVAEIMFGDFLFLAGDQIVNHAAKYRV